MKFILASESPRRRSLLKQAGIICEAVLSGADETLPQPLPPDETVRILSGRKADSALKLRGWERPSVIIAADTIVYLNGKILGKPSGRAEAVEMLSELQGQVHTVYTGVALRYLKTKPGGGANVADASGFAETGAHAACADCRTPDTVESLSFVETAKVKMRVLSQKEIERYVATGEPDDKAGAYGVQGLGSALVERVEGDYHTVVGLPLARLCEALKSWGVDYTEGWRYA